MFAKTLVHLVALLLLATVTTHACEFVVGYDEAPPFHYSDTNGKIIGTDADILRESMASTGCSLTFKELPWSRTLAGVENGSVSIAIGAKYTDERAKFALYSTPYKTIQHWLYTQAGQHDEIDSLAAFLGTGERVLGVVLGWGYPPEIAKLINDKKFKERVTFVTSFELLPKMLAMGRVDGIIAIPESLKKVIKTEQITTSFVDRAHYQEPLHYLFSRESVKPAVVIAFNEGFFKLTSEGRVGEIFRQHLK